MSAADWQAMGLVCDLALVVLATGPEQLVPDLEHVDDGGGLDKPLEAVQLVAVAGQLHAISR